MLRLHSVPSGGAPQHEGHEGPEELGAPLIRSVAVGGFVGLEGGSGDAPGEVDREVDAAVLSIRRRTSPIIGAVRSVRSTDR